MKSPNPRTSSWWMWPEMEFKIITDWTVEDLTRSWIAGEMRSNPEYQRGAKWSLPQRQSLIDSVFRLYPVPPMFLQEITKRGLKGDSSVYEIVDGQQRIVSLSNFVKDSSRLSTPTTRSCACRTPFGPASRSGGGAQVFRPSRGPAAGIQENPAYRCPYTDGSRRRSSRSIYQTSGWHRTHAARGARRLAR